MILRHLEFELDDDKGRVDFGKLHSWLTETYWCPGITRANVEKAARISPLLVGAYDGDELVGFARVVTDLVRFAYLCDVYVEESLRGKGLGRALVSYLLYHPEMAGLKKVLLATADAHGVYGALGFVGLVESGRADRFMMWDRPAPQ